MPFCTKCGANVSGAFCSQCGTPAGSAASPQTVSNLPYAQPPVTGTVPPTRKTSPVVWVLVIVLAFFVLCGGAVIGAIALAAHTAHRAGLSFNRGKDGGFSIQARGADGKNARVDIGSSMKNVPAWVPIYPGAEAHGAFAAQGGDGAGGVFSFTTPDDMGSVREFYSRKVQDLGMRVEVDSVNGATGTIVAADDAGERRSLTITAKRHGSGSTVSVEYGSK